MTGRIDVESGAARLKNCNGASGDPDEGVDFTECGLLPLGVERIKDGIGLTRGSGVRGGDVIISGASSNVAELIHLSSRDPKRGDPKRLGDSGGIIRNTSAKWSLMNFDNSCHPPPTRTMTV